MPLRIQCDKCKCVPQDVNRGWRYVKNPKKQYWCIPDGWQAVTVPYGVATYCPTCLKEEGVRDGL